MHKKILIVAVLFALGACSQYSRADRALIGGGLGAATGAVIGAASGNRSTALAGAGIGALAGGLVGAYALPRRCVDYDKKGRPYYYNC